LAVALSALDAFAAPALEVPKEAVDALYRPWQTLSARVSPDGSLVVALVAEGEKVLVRVSDPESGASLDAFELRGEASNSVEWIDGATLAVEERHHGELRFGESGTHVAAIRRSAAGLEKEAWRIQTKGWLVSALPQADDAFLYAVADEGAVYRLSARALLALGRPGATGSEPDLFSRDACVARLGGAASHWVTDAQGRVRAAIAVSPHDVRLFYREARSERFRKIKTWSAAGGPFVLPFAMANDGRNLLVLSNEGVDRVGLYEWDPRERAQASLVYEHPVADVLGVLGDENGRIVGVVYSQSGEPVYHYFREGDAQLQGSLQSHFPGQSIAVVSRSRDAKQVMLFVSDSADPGSFQLLDVERDEIVEVGRQAPWLDPARLRPALHFPVDAADGLSLDAFVTLPAGVDSPPLVVVPHGGPLGVLDLRTFDRSVQHLALAGFAVLQVNYRGSAGRGRAFLDAGRREWGRGIEDDIDRAIAAAVERGWVDPDRMCIAGSSYGGYSALMSVIRYPGRFRCAASLAGITDIALMFTSSDFSASQEGRAFFAEVVGDPALHYDELKSRSPVYRASEIDAPLLLMHGARDARVHPEHSWRLRAMLDLYGKPYEWVLVDAMGHSFETLEQLRTQMDHLVRFLAEHLGPDGS
jgi:dipeptidyl aminopeptidase/acylaminoacyl peptidase